MGSMFFSAVRPIFLARIASVRSASVNSSRRRPSRTRNARFSAFRYSISAAAVCSSQKAMPHTSKAKKFFGDLHIE